MILISRALYFLKIFIISLVDVFDLINNWTKFSSYSYIVKKFVVNFELYGKLPLIFSSNEFIFFFLSSVISLFLIKSIIESKSFFSEIASCKYISLTRVSLFSCNISLFWIKFTNLSIIGSITTLYLLIFNYSTINGENRTSIISELCIPKSWNAMFIPTFNLEIKYVTFL
jgi:hypothetical protein